MRFPVRIFCIALLCGATLPAALLANLPSEAHAVTQTQPDAAGVAISFAPTDGARFERLLTSQTSTAQGEHPISLGEVRARVAERWERAGDQWLLHCTPLEVSVQNSARPLLSTTQQVILEQPYTVVFDNNGEVVEVRGFDDLTEKLKAALPEDGQGPILAVFTPEKLRQRVANSQNYQFNWLYGKHWQPGQQHTATLDLQAVIGWPAKARQTSTITAIDASVLLLSFANDDTLPNPEKTFTIHLSEKGTATLDSTSGQLRQLQKTRLGRTEFASGEGEIIAINETEVITINWNPVE